MKRLSAAVLGALLIGCSGGGHDDSGHVCSGANTIPPPLDADYASRFTGRWEGVGTVYIDGFIAFSGSGFTNITTDGVNKLELRGDGDYYPALVTGASTFEVVCYQEPTSASGCGAIWSTVEAGSGVLDSTGTILSIDTTGTLVGCGESHTVRVVLSAATRSAPGLAATSAQSQAGSLQELLVRGWDAALAR